MARKQRFVVKDANTLLPRGTSEALISDIQKTLSEDPSIEAQYQLKFMLTKFCETNKEGAESRKLAAITKWQATEERNTGTNERLRAPIREPRFDVAERCGDEFLSRVRQVVSDVLGDTPSLDVAYAAYSGGASTSRRRSEGHPALKFLGQADSTRRAWETFQRLAVGTMYEDHIYQNGLEPRLVRGSVLFTVPKNSEIDRVACKEPDINVFLQKMFGRQIRTLLRRKGINLNDQSINGELARVGSVDGSLATLDLSSASDSVTTELVRRVLPDDWFYWLDSVRSHEVNVDGVYQTLEMFSSMGNGFTFELESVIFYAIARVCGQLTGIRGRISVYGDDIVVPTELVPYVISGLTLCGFLVNEEKSFFEGPFRESCGSYWHAGINVKPFFIKGPLTRTTDLIKTLNALTAWATFGGILDPRYEEIIEKYKSLVDPDLHGGQDTTSITSLVTGDAPRKELRPVSKVRLMNHVGGYLAWLQATALRLTPSSVEIVGSSPGPIYRIKRNRQQWMDIPVFLGRYVDQLEATPGEVILAR